MSQIVAKLLFGGVLAVILTSCYGTQLAAERHTGPVILAYNFSHARAFQDPLPQATLAIGVGSLNQGSVLVRGFHEPGDFAHRNYCGAGATQVLLSGWMQNVPDIETVASRSHLDPNKGEKGADALGGINSFLTPIVDAQVGHPWYRAEHITTLDEVMTRIRKDILDPSAIQTFGHGVPVMVQTMTRTMPGWNHWNATHMITIFAFDFSHNDVLKDTVTYAETPSPLAGYRGPDFQTISVQALWVAMEQYNVQAPYDPMNVIW
jgi:hypothetical protein